MFICCDCKKEYKTKPDYCDCGNDNFQEIKEKIKINYNYLSLIFFIFCIIFSILILIFFNYPKQKEHKNITKKEILKTNKNIPDINSFWKEKEPETIVLPNIKPEIKEIKKEEPKQIKKINKNPTTITTPKKQPKKKEIITTVEKPKEVKKIIKKEKNKTIIKEQDIKSYKNELRNLIFSNIAFDNIYEDGSCSVSFNIEPNGLLINKKTISSTQNIELNNAVFKAILKINYFKTPPTSLNNHTYIFKINIYNDKYEASLN